MTNFYFNKVVFYFLNIRIIFQYHLIEVREIFIKFSSHEALQKYGSRIGSKSMLFEKNNSFLASMFDYRWLKIYHI